MLSRPCDVLGRLSAMPLCVRWSVMVPVRPVNVTVGDLFGRADLGIKLLSLKPVAALVRPGPAAPGSPSLINTATLREAVASLAAHGVAVLTVVDANNTVLGSLHAADVFAPERHG